MKIGVAPDFGDSFWRAASLVMVPLPALSAGAVGDETFRLLADNNIPTLCWVANGDGYIV